MKYLFNIVHKRILVDKIYVNNFQLRLMLIIFYEHMKKKLFLLDSKLLTFYGYNQQPEMEKTDRERNRRPALVFVNIFSSSFSFVSDFEFSTSTEIPLFRGPTLVFTQYDEKKECGMNYQWLEYIPVICMTVISEMGGTMK